MSDVYLVVEYSREDGLDILGVFDSEEAARDCTANQWQQILRIPIGWHGRSIYTFEPIDGW